MSAPRRRWLGLWLVLLAGAAGAHPLAPALLSAESVGEGRFLVLWKTSAQRVDPLDLVPRLPAHCQPLGEPLIRRNTIWVTEQFQVDCGTRGLAGETIAIDGLAQSVKDVVLRVADRQGRIHQHVLRAGETDVTLRETPDTHGVLLGYAALGVPHILGGFDHVLLVLGFVVLLGATRRLVWLLTGFTLGHSLTLALAVTGRVQVPSAPVEVLIAFTLVILAAELIRGDARRGRLRSWWLAVAFGLLHGLGFAGELIAIGLPADGLWQALLGFNLGVEVGQLLIVLAAVVLGLAWRRAAGPPGARWPVLAGWLIGLPAAYFTVARLVVMLHAPV